MAAIALYASLFEPNIQTLHLNHPPHSHADAPIFLNILRYLDIPQAIAMAAEHTQVRVIQENDFEWRFAKDVVRKLKWPEKQFKCKVGKR